MLFLSSRKTFGYLLALSFYFSQMTKFFPLFLLTVLMHCAVLHAQSSDTLVVQTFSFGSKQDSTFNFPSDTGHYQKVLMYYTLKCNAKQNPACGQWDYLTYTFLYQKTGTFDSTFVRDSVYNSVTQKYDKDSFWKKTPHQERYELGRYITPYGINLSLGNGFTWVFDVTDYLPLLHDSVHLAAGNWQELLDVKFIFIKGTPPRKPYKVVNLWNGEFLFGQPTPMGDIMGPRKVTIDNNASYVKVKIRPTGHGEDGSNCAEFCPVNHFMYIDGTQRWTKLVWRDNCAFNPLQPQGGTWLLQRANWCPGAEVQTYEADVTPYVTPGQSYTFTYGADDYTTSSSNSGNSTPYYDIETQVIYYGPAAFKNDAAVERIIAPSTENMFGHLNPVCGHPVILIKNTGSNTLTTLKITYGVQGSTMTEYDWKGNLNFMDTARVVLDPPSWAGAGSNSFQVTVSEPNGVQDEYAGNNTAYSTIPLTPKYNNSFVIWTRTNSAPEDNAYTIQDVNGKVWFSRTDFAKNTLYRDTITLPHGCYTFRFTDANQDGLSFFANPGAGNGTLRIFTTDGKVLKTFNPDFGGEILYDFSVEYGMSINEKLPAATIDVYPNPGHGIFNVDVSLLGNKSCTVKVFTMVGQEVFSQQRYANAGLIPVDLSTVSPGVYVLQVNNGTESFSKRIVIER
jgi:hypothetical protein